MDSTTSDKLKPDTDPHLPVTSSAPPLFGPEEQECYRDVLNALREANIPFAVAGAFALHRHTGIWRTTKDLDVFLEPDWVTPALAALRPRGFETYIKDPVWLAKAIRGKYFVDLITALGNAALIVDSEWMARSHPDEVFGVPCQVLGAEEMIASKVFVTRRERFDGADVAHLIRAVGQRLDWDRLLHLLEPHWELLLSSLTFFAYIYPAQTDAVPQSVWTELIARFQEQVRIPRRSLPFRGTLIDPNMFAIDVADWHERDLYKEYCEQHPHLLADPESNHPEEER